MGKIGKPQRSKKHKKLKNVEGYETSNNARTAVQNLAPNNDDYQEIPRKVQHLAEKKAEFKKMKKRKKFKNEQDKNTNYNVENEKGMTRPFKAAPKFVQGKRESEKQFLKRVEIETQKVLLKSKLAKKFGMDIEEFESGSMKKKKGMSETKKMRLKEKKAKKKERKTEVKQDKFETEKFDDKVQFGEVVMAPPVLTAKPRKSEQKVDRPGKKSLLLKEIIADNATVNPLRNFSSQRKVGETMKRKHMSMAQQNIMDTERLRAIELYRQNKNKKFKVS